MLFFEQLHAPNDTLEGDDQWKLTPVPGKVRIPVQPVSASETNVSYKAKCCRTGTLASATTVAIDMATAIAIVTTNFHLRTGALRFV